MDPRAPDVRDARAVARIPKARREGAFLADLTVLLKLAYPVRGATRAARLVLAALLVEIRAILPRRRADDGPGEGPAWSSGDRDTDRAEGEDMEQGRGQAEERIWANASHILSSGPRI
jgi:hypothetical protein